MKDLSHDIDGKLLHDDALIFVLDEEEPVRGLYGIRHVSLFMRHE